jgi:predicted NUDIX family NTP pyrophosphohydrolase
MSKKSAGILLYRVTNKPEVFLVHPGGPFWKKKDAGAWTIPKGEFNEDEKALDAAIREFKEETGMAVEGPFIPLDPIKQKSGKLVLAWAMKGDLTPEKLQSNMVTMEWPPKTGKQISFPEIDRGEWFSVDAAREKINAAQVDFLDQLEDCLDLKSPD